MSTKDCPSCGAEAPASATRCKECFHDFTSERPKSTSYVGPLIVLGSVAAMAIVGTLVLLLVFMQPVEERVLVDEDTRSIVWTTKFRTGIETDRVMFDQVSKIEHNGTGGTFQLLAITTDGDRRILMEDNSSLAVEGRHYAQLMEKPFEDVDPSTVLNRKKK